MKRGFDEAAQPCQVTGADAAAEARRRPIAEFGHREVEFRRWVDGYALAAWIHATEDLLTLDAPLPWFPRRKAGPALAQEVRK
jgi:hypothetical protein